jgi:hypothetical protein
VEKCSPGRGAREKEASAFEFSNQRRKNKNEAWKYKFVEFVFFNISSFARLRGLVTGFILLNAKFNC